MWNVCMQGVTFIRLHTEMVLYKAGFNITRLYAPMLNMHEIFVDGSLLTFIKCFQSLILKEIKYPFKKLKKTFRLFTLKS